MLDPYGPDAQRRLWTSRMTCGNVCTVHLRPTSCRGGPRADSGTAVPPGRTTEYAQGTYARLVEDAVAMYKEFLGEVVVWLIPVVVLVALALMITSHPA